MTGASTAAGRLHDGEALLHVVDVEGRDAVLRSAASSRSWRSVMRAMLVSSHGSGRAAGQPAKGWRVRAPKAAAARALRRYAGSRRGNSAGWQSCADCAALICRSADFRAAPRNLRECGRARISASGPTFVPMNHTSPESASSRSGMYCSSENAGLYSPPLLPRTPISTTREKRESNRRMTSAV